MAPRNRLANRGQMANSCIMKHMDAYGNVGFVLVLVMTLHVSMKDRKHMDEVLLMHKWK